ncbi:LacI family DNA-binding transcriptional regulator [Compostimonas suwonensis]|uniref:DNA-binding LacI/PurR family transcriptional regulator n=1 Tax=Compostimonas suwonensis TaxID=1048394 RepID=A0A2M9BCM0_9MICO|nr:LacI family DNA-binding transcriptional regulator [Compostimonas suwonensis]PJJ55654.1 DNA-binding LacI/PurR family transcriptional regulator [Compostimonas suwonensis]
MAATLHDVARVAGVSIKTVSNVINDYPHVRPETKERVLAAIAELGYRPNLSARNLRSGRTGMISLIIPNLRNPYFAELADDVMNAASARGLSVLIEQVGGDRESELSVLRGSRRQAVDGILYSVLALGQEDAAVLDEIPLPMVLLGERIFNSSRDHVTMRNEDGLRAATEHLLAIGCRRIIALGSHPGEVIGSAGLRLDGYLQALDAAGVPVDERLIVHADRWHRVDGAAAMRSILAAGTEFDGIVAFNDSLALGAMRIMQEAGLRIPQDVAVIGFDDLDETRYSVPTLSTIEPGRPQIAETAVDMLLARIEERASAESSPAEPREVLTDFRLVQRESTTRAAGAPGSSGL